MLLHSLASVILALSAVPSSANGTSVGEQAANDDSQAVKCRSVIVVGSRIPTRVCRTKAEWAQIDEDNQAALDEKRRNRAFAAGANQD